jgi:hypothetical protein
MAERFGLFLALSAIMAGAVSAQTSRVTMAVGGTWLDFAPTWGDNFGALTAQARLLWPFAALQPVDAEISALLILPLGASIATADCIVGQPCIDYQTPDALVAFVGSFSGALGPTGLRGSVGIGRLTTSGMKGPSRISSAVGSVGVDWAPEREGLTLTIGVRALVLTDTIAGLGYVVLPTIGFTF